ncbi:reverse transcriptase domain-containing protein, partial [Tanacetum coccineum]
MSTSEAPTMTQAAIRKLVANSVTAALEAQATNMANTDNTTRPREASVIRQCSYKEFTSFQPINFKGTVSAIGLIYWFERTELVFSRSNCTEDYKVMFATGTLTEEALSWWNSFAEPIGIEEAYKITWGNDLKTYVRRFQELATLCPTMVPDFEKMMEVFIGGLPQSIEGNVGHLTKNCRNKRPATGSNLLPVIVTYHACGQKRHYANQCRNTTNNNAQGRTYMLRDRNAHQDPNVVTGPCTVKCNTCNKVGHLTKNCRNKGPATRSNLLPVTVTYHAYGEKGHYANQCRKSTNNNAQGRTYMLSDRNAHQDLNVVT